MRSGGAGKRPGWPWCSQASTRQTTNRNGQPAAVASHRDSAYGLGVLTVTPAGIARVTVFAGGPDLAASFGLA